uniref:Uncharacterized protein n=1 Tax=Brassica campestris TaxID=3711 RepID=A0A3P6A8X9_BRACM|nr:unnamed protein product [Brassica rapa]
MDYTLATTASRDASPNTGHQAKGNVKPILGCLCACATTNVNHPR